MYEKSKSDRRGIFSLEEYSQMGNSEMERATNNQHKHRRWRICSIQQLLWSSWRSLLLLGSRTQTIAKVFQSGGNANPPVFSLGAVNGAQKFAKCANFHLFLFAFFADAQENLRSFSVVWVEIGKAAKSFHSIGTELLCKNIPRIDLEIFPQNVQ